MILTWVACLVAGCVSQLLGAEPRSEWSILTYDPVAIINPRGGDGQLSPMVRSLQNTLNSTTWASVDRGALRVDVSPDGQALLVTKSASRGEERQFRIITDDGSVVDGTAKGRVELVHSDIVVIYSRANQVAEVLRVSNKLDRLETPVLLSGLWVSPAGTSWIGTDAHGIILGAVSEENRLVSVERYDTPGASLDPTYGSAVLWIDEQQPVVFARVFGRQQSSAILIRWDDGARRWRKAISVSYPKHLDVGADVFVAEAADGGYRVMNLSGDAFGQPVPDRRFRTSGVNVITVAPDGLSLIGRPRVFTLPSGVAPLTLYNVDANGVKATCGDIPGTIAGWIKEANIPMAP